MLGISSRHIFRGVSIETDPIVFVSLLSELQEVLPLLKAVPLPLVAAAVVMPTGGKPVQQHLPHTHLLRLRLHQLLKLHLILRLQLQLQLQLRLRLQLHRLLKLHLNLKMQTRPAR